MKEGRQGGRRGQKKIKGRRDGERERNYITISFINIDPNISI
jgi:hypothetical protein